MCNKIDYKIMEKVKRDVGLYEIKFRATENARSIPEKDKQTMVKRYSQYREFIEPIMAEVHKILCDVGVGVIWFMSYKNFVQQCVKAIREQSLNDPSQSADLTFLTRVWKKRGLRRDVMEKIKKVIIEMTG
jgi:hypothetical protein